MISFMVRKIRNYLVIGLFTLLPAIATLYIFKLVFSFVDRILGNFFTDILINFGLAQDLGENLLFLGYLIEDQERIPGLGFISLFMILFLVGYSAKTLLGRKVIIFTERNLKKIPIAKSIYSTVQQIINAFFQDRSSFQKVVLVEYPRKGIYTMGFLTGETQGQVHNKLNKDCLNVFLPTTPNPTSGWLALVPKEDVIFLDLTVEQGLKFVISGGVVSPHNENTSLLHKEQDGKKLNEIFTRLKRETKMDKLKKKKKSEKREE